MYSAGSTDNRPFLSSAVHSCNTGYTITGGTLNGGTTRVCVTGGNWDGSPPTCQGELNSCTIRVCEYSRLLLFRLSEARLRYIYQVFGLVARCLLHKNYPEMWPLTIPYYTDQLAALN